MNVGMQPQDHVSKTLSPILILICGLHVQPRSIGFVVSCTHSATGFGLPGEAGHRSLTALTPHWCQAGVGLLEAAGHHSGGGGAQFEVLGHQGITGCHRRAEKGVGARGLGIAWAEGE